MHTFSTSGSTVAGKELCERVFSSRSGARRLWQLAPVCAKITSLRLQITQQLSLQVVDLFNSDEASWTELIDMDRLDETDRRILLALDDDPRMPVALLAQRLSLARGTVHARLERLATSGVLRASSTRVRPDSLGRGVAASIRVELDQHQIVAAIDALRKVPEVLECFAPAGDTDLLLRVVAKSPDDLYRVAEVIRLCPGILRTSTSLFLREVIPYRVSELLAAE